MLALIGALALAIGIVLGAGLPGSSNGASQPAKSSGSTIVQERNLVATDTESGTLSYANPQTVFNRLSGTLTSLPKVGQVVRPGQTLYTVNGAPVVLFDGTTPAYRDLSASVTDGTDVQELKQNLVALGFDPSHQITINTTFDAATTAAVERWQASLNETQTGTVTLGQIVFLPGIERITAVDTVLGSTGGASGAGAGSTGSTNSASGTTTGASTSPVTPRTEFVSLTTTPVKSASPKAGAVSSASNATASASCPAPHVTTGSSTTPTQTATTPTQTPPACNVSSSGKSSHSSPSTLAALIALLKAETLELKKSKTATSTPAASGAGGRTAGGASSSTASAGRSGGGGGGGATSSATGTASGGSSTSGSTGASTAQAILQTTSTELVVTVALDATKQSEAVVGQPVTVQLPNGSTVNGKITQVSPVAQTASSTSSASGAGGAASSAPSATVPVTITLSGHRPDVGLDQAAVSVNFEQQSAHNVLSVPVTALLATAGGGYAIQEAAPPHQLIPVTTGLFAAGYVQISGSQVAAGLQVTDSQG